ncbi:MAG: hypothetical protein ACXW3O_00495 [Brevundimonas sp.]
MQTAVPGSPTSPSAIDAALAQSAAFHSLTPGAQEELRGSLGKVFDYLAHGEGARSLAGSPLDQLRQGGGSGPGPARPGDGRPPHGAGGGAGGRPAAAGAAGADTFQRASRATREMLGAIDFPGFVSSIVAGTFQSIVDASIQQMEAYAQLLSSVAKSVDSFMDDHISDAMAKDHLADNYGDVFHKTIDGSRPRLGVRTDSQSALPSFLRDMGFESPADIDEEALETVVVPDTRRQLAEMRHQSLATMVMMGINRVVVQDGEINAKLVFHVDASESMDFTFNENKPTNWTMPGQAGRNSFAASGILVSTTNVNTQSDLNMRADLTGEVKIRFKSDYFPLERFADSNAIQLINSRAKVPIQATAAPAAGATPGDPAALPAPAGPVATAPGVVRTPAATPAQQSSFAQSALVDDPWMPRS